jgi:hypothetical protein
VGAAACDDASAFRVALGGALALAPGARRSLPVTFSPTEARAY